ncbi:hypothetical protein AAVH_22597, partial [Aphelenchoides avenae]
MRRSGSQPEPKWTPLIAEPDKKLPRCSRSESYTNFKFWRTRDAHEPRPSVVSLAPDHGPRRASLFAEGSSALVRRSIRKIGQNLAQPLAKRTVQLKCLLNA